MRRLLVLVALVSSSAAAQEQRNYTVTLTPAQVFYIGKLLDEEKRKDSGELYNSIQIQIRQQDQAAQTSAVESLRKQGRDAAEKEARDKAETESKKESQP